MTRRIAPGSIQKLSIGLCVEGRAMSSNGNSYLTAIAVRVAGLVPDQRLRNAREELFAGYRVVGKVEQCFELLPAKRGPRCALDLPSLVESDASEDAGDLWPVVPDPAAGAHA